MSREGWRHLRPFQDRPRARGVVSSPIQPGWQVKADLRRGSLARVAVQIASGHCTQGIPSPSSVEPGPTVAVEVERWASGRPTNRQTLPIPTSEQPPSSTTTKPPRISRRGLASKGGPSENSVEPRPAMEGDSPENKLHQSGRHPHPLHSRLPARCARESTGLGRRSESSHRRRYSDGR